MSNSQMHYARLEKSPRLQRLLAVLQNGYWHSTRELILRANICAVNSTIAELRANGFEIECRQVGRGRFEYLLKKEM